MKRKLLRFLIALLALELVSAVPLISIEPSTVVAQPNREFTVNININTDRDVYGVQFELVYDASLLSLSSIAEGNFLNSRGVNTYAIHKPAQGRSTYAITRTIVRSGVNGIGTLATARFLPLRAGQATIRLSDVKVADPAILPVNGVRTTDSTVGIYAATPPAQPTSERRRSSGGGSSSASGTTPSTTIIASQPDDEAGQGTAEQPKEKTERLILKSAERSENQPITEEEINLAKSIFPVGAFIVMALGALAFAYRKLLKR